MRILLTALLFYLATYSLCNVNDIPSFIVAILFTFLSSFLILITWDIIPVCKFTNNHVPILKNGVYYCKYCKQPLKRL
jgi:hypothetical protein